MKVLLIRPNHPTYFITPALGIGYLSACFKKAGIESVIVDGVKDNLSEDAIISKVNEEKPEWIGITCMSAYFNETKSLSLRLKDMNYKVIIGGQHPTFMPYMTLVETKCDYVICGEGEISIVQLVQQGNNEEIKGVYSLNELKDENTPFEKSEIYQNLDDIPFPDWEQMDPRTYAHAPMGMVVKGYPVAVMMSSRGCPYGCVYCAGGKFYDRKVRFRSAEM